MSNEIMLEKLLSASSDPVQSESIMGMMGQAVEFMKKVDSIVSMCQKWGLSPQIVEKLAIKYGELDKVAALPEQKTTIIQGIVGKSEFHTELFKALNEVNEDEIKKMMSAQLKSDDTRNKRKS